MARSRKGAGRQSRLRIIGGKWRSRKLAFTAAEGLRPTTDRIRETLFNWLAPHIQGARCVDLFAGSGALGLEALSRGASHCDFVDNSSAALAQISAHLATLGAAELGQCHAASALQFLETSSNSYDIVFIDPPFTKDLVAPTCHLLTQHRALSKGARVYLEMASSEPLPQMPSGWILHREKVASGVSYRLFLAESMQDDR